MLNFILDLSGGIANLLQMFTQSIDQSMFFLSYSSHRTWRFVR